MSASIFSKIIAREIPAHFVYEDEHCVVILDKFPNVRGQSLVIPKIETDYIFDLPEKLYQHLFEVAKRVAKASDKAFLTERTCLVVEGFEVPHVHIKLYPMEKGETNLGKKLVGGPDASDDALAEIASELRAHLAENI